MILQPMNTGDTEPAATGEPDFPQPARQSNRLDKLRILLVAHKFPPFIGGIEMHTFEVGRRMAALGHTVTVLTGDPSKKLPKREMMAGMCVMRVPAYPKSSDIFLAPGVYREIARGEWDIVHVQGFHTFVPPLAMMGCLRSSAAFVMTFHSGGHSSPLRNLIRGVQRAVLRPLIVRADKLIAVSEFEADHFARGLRVPRDQIVVVANGAEIETPLEAPPPTDPNKPLIVTIGRLERYKGHQRVIDAFAQLLKQRPNSELRVIGEGPYKLELVRQVRTLGLEGRVTIGGIPPKQRRLMGDILSKASVVVLLSDYEAHPVAALEAIAAGRTVLATNATGFSEMVSKGQVRGVEPGATPQAVAAAIIEEIDRPATNKPPLVMHDWNDCTQELLQVYREVMDRRGHRPGAVAAGESGPTAMASFGKGVRT